MSLLYSLSEKHKTNKSWHGYMSFYEKLLDPIRLDVTHMLEIGIDQGSSLKVWKEYFPKSAIFGIDLVIPDCVKNAEYVCGVGDQSNPADLQKLLRQWGNPQFDCIIDDGGHTVKQQRVSIETLWSSVRPGGYYIIEDLHTNIRAMHYIHPHLNAQSKHIDELPTVHEKIINTMCGSKKEFSFSSSDIEEILYFNTPNKLSLSCAFKKL
jgi:hypothetical protein